MHMNKQILSLKFISLLLIGLLGLVNKSNAQFSISGITRPSEICSNGSGNIAVNISGTTTGTVTVVWTTTNGGTFGNVNAMSTTFTPSATDYSLGYWELAVTVTDDSGTQGFGPVHV